ncbi:MAG: phosphate acyltransferase [Candidatus Stygibacter australis]|nr:phosphate acyltransferase [Candidatus Stygibacter australis]MDP8322362.1 phosphate acyltransferase [Candidatus Stygibacter australis]
MPIKKLEDIIRLLKSKPKKRIVVASANDETTILAVKDTIALNFAEVTLVGDEAIIKDICKQNDIDPAIFEIIHETDDLMAAKKAIALIKAGKGDVLMKGLISTDKLTRCILDKEDGLMIPGAILSHVSIAEIPTHRKLLIFSDAAFIPRPNIDQKIAMTNYVIETARKIGIKRPKVAIISFSEKANPKIKETVDALIISKMGEQGLIKNADIDGPLAIDLAIDPESVKVKGVKSCVKGDADCLIFPFLEVGNVFFKSLTYFAGAVIATYIVGTQAPVVISSRVDTEKSKLYSMAFTCLMSS